VTVTVTVTVTACVCVCVCVVLLSGTAQYIWQSNMHYKMPLVIAYQVL